MKIAKIGFFVLVIFWIATASAKNVDLSTVPKRNSVQLTIYNSEDLTLVRERRTITFSKGNNPLQFSWASTLIDPSSVRIQFVDHADELEVQDTTFPLDKPQMLFWGIESKFDGQATVEITYFTSGISWKADYICIAGSDEKQMGLDGFVRIYNYSGEQYENAEIRLVVGTINLVEKIAELAHVPVERLQEQISVDAIENYRRDAAREYFSTIPATQPAMAGERDEKKIIKQGLSEYFIYSIEGTETIENGWSKRMRSFEGKTVPFKIQYRYRPVEYGDQLVRMYILTNDKDSKLGTTPLPDGTVRVFRDNGRDGLSYLTAQPVKYIPIGDKIELNLGEDPNVRFELIKEKCFRDNIWVKLDSIEAYRRAEDKNGGINVRSTVAGWDDHEVFAQRIRNYTTKPIDVEIRRSFPGDVKFLGKLGQTLFDFQTVQFQATINPAERRDLEYQIITREGTSSKQNHVELETTDANPRF